MSNSIEVIEVKTDVLIINENKCFIPMFKYNNSHWCYSLPTTKSMYFDTIENCEKSIERQKNDKHPADEYRIAKFIN